MPQSRPDQLRILNELRDSSELFAEIANAHADPLQIQKRLRKTHTDEIVRTALTMHGLRLRAASKFERASSMWFDRQRLEQATSELIARHKAKRFHTISNDGAILDLCCGIGGDAIAFSESAGVIGIDADPLATTMAEWNCEVYQTDPNFSSKVADVEQIDFENRFVHIDPDRRNAAGKRSLRLEGYQPNLEFLQSLQRRAKGGAIKVGPASNFGGKFPRTEIELISLNGECKEAVIWFGELAGDSETRATLLPSGVSITGDPLAAYVDIAEPKTFIYDPDPAVVRAGLIDVLAESLQLSRLDPSEEYLTGETPIDSPFVQCFQIVESLPYQQKSLKQFFRTSEIGQLEIKTRHLKADVEKLRKQLPLNGNRAGVLILVKNENKTRALVCTRVSFN